ncbi:MAG: 1-deoxy-D-xylulose-5-phosphate reductoisomerase [Terrimicrobiaceae bacterium]
MKRRIAILGASGSIGASALKVARDIPDRVEILGASAHTNTQALAEIQAEFPSARCVLSGSEGGDERLVELATLPDVDMVLIAIVGTAGLRPALAAIEAGKDIAVASKEILVMAGEIVMAAAHAKGVRVLPVDSEHNAIFQCLEGRSIDSVRRLVLTCSGGPFREFPTDRFESITPEMALKHPTWTMGRKITVDSATLFNKALEMIEARWLFGVAMDQVDVIIHPQSIIHSMVEFVDCSVLAQMSHSDMCFPIQYALTWPERVRSSLQPMDFASFAKLDFFAPRRVDFPALDLAVEAGNACGTMPAVLNAANEVAVESFLARRIAFPQIWEIVRTVMDQCPHSDHPDLDVVLAADHDARSIAQSLVTSRRIP